MLVRIPDSALYTLMGVRNLLNLLFLPFSLGNNPEKRKRRKAPTPRDPLPLKKKPKHEECNIARIEILKHEERIMQLEAEVLRLK